MRRGLCAALLFLCAFSEAAPRKKLPAGVKLRRDLSKSPPGMGQVRYATATEVFVDRGRADGLSEGQTLKLSRGGRGAGKCVIRQIADHSAVCEGSARVGDRFSFEPPAKPKPVRPPEVTSAEELEEQREAVLAAKVPLRDFDGATVRTQVLSRRIDVSLSHATHASLSSSDGPFQHQWLDASAQNIQLTQSLSASLQLSAHNWSRRPANFRSPYRASSQLYLRQLELLYRPLDRGLSVAAGRAWTRHAPGLSLLDGAQAGFRGGEGTYEAGLFAGLLPDPLTLEPSTTRWTVGGYFTRTFSNERDGGRLVMPEVRAAWVTRPSLGARAELDAAVHAWIGQRYDAHAELQLGVGDSQAPLLVDLVRLDVSARPSDRVRLQLSGRYRGINLDEVQTVGVILPGNRALHADGLATLDVSQALTVGLTAGTVQDFSSNLEQHRVGPELWLPRLFGRFGGLSMGYAEQLGWLRGRDGYLQLVLSPSQRFRVIARASYFAQVLGTEAEPQTWPEAGGYLAFDAAITQRLWLRAWLLGRRSLYGALEEEGGGERAPAGVSAALSLGGGF